MVATDHTTTTLTTTTPHHTTHNRRRHSHSHSHSHTATHQHNTTQQVHLDNLFLHEAGNSPTNEGPRPTHSGPQSKCFLHRELIGRVIIVIVAILAQAILAQELSGRVIIVTVIVIDSPHRFGEMLRQWWSSNSRWWQHGSWKHWRSSPPYTGRMGCVERGSRRQTATPSLSDFPSTVSWVAGAPTRRHHSTREPHRGSEDGSYRCSLSNSSDAALQGSKNSKSN